MKNKKIFIIFVIIVALLLLGLFYFMFIYDFEKVNRSRDDTSKPQQESSEQDGGIDRMPVNDDEEDKEDDKDRTVRHEGGDGEVDDPANEDSFNEVSLKNMASSFAERFGSYSNHSNYGNFDDLEVFMTDDMKEWAEDFVKEEREKEATNNDYHGVTTKAISANVKEFDKEQGVAEVVVFTKRKESENERSNFKTFDQRLTLEFINQNGVWKVDGTFWEE